MHSRAAAILAGSAAALLALWAWQSAASSEQRQIRRQLHGFTSELNGGATEGLGALARTLRIGEFFTPDVVVELGQGSPPITGRDTLLGMAARLQSRTADFYFELEDIAVELLDGVQADVTLTAVIRRRGGAPGEESMDAREFAGEMRYVDGDWRVSRVVAVDTLR